MMGDFLSLFDMETRRLQSASSGRSDAEIFPPIPTRNDFSGNAQASDETGFPTFPTFPTHLNDGPRDDGFRHGFRGQDQGPMTEVQPDENARVEVLHGNGGKVGNPTESISLKRERWEKWEKPAPSLSAREDDRAAFDERAAILEYDGGFDRPEAEALAGEQMTALHAGRPAPDGPMGPEQDIQDRARARRVSPSWPDAKGLGVARSEAGIVKREHVA